MNKTTLPAVATILNGVLGSHLVLRNALLSSDREGASPYYANAYTWTRVYCTLMSTGQVTGKFASNENKYDDGEANYKLPLFNYESWSFDDFAWLRGLCTYGGNSGIYGFTTSGSSSYKSCSNVCGLRPLIYIR